MKKVIIESPYKGDLHRNIEYAKRCMIDSIARGEAPFGSHLLYTQVLDDNNEEERKAGMLMGFEWIKSADLVAIYTDYGVSEGMEMGVYFAIENGKRFEYRKIGK